MSKIIAIMSMSLAGFVADPDDGVAEVFDWYFNSGDVEFHTGGGDPMTFRVSESSAGHLRGLWPKLGAMLTGRRTFTGTPAVLGNPTVTAGAGVTHLRYPASRASSQPTQQEP